MGEGISMYDLAVKNGFIFRNSRLEEGNLYIKDGIIEEISPRDYEAVETLDGEGLHVFPGIIDPHVHFALSVGNSCSSDDFSSGSAAGLYGGVTSYIDFLDPVSQGSAVESAFMKRKELAAGSYSDYSFHVTAANPVGETARITEEALRLNLPSIKVFTAYSESGRRTYEKELRELLALSEKKGTVLLVHGEDENHILTDSRFGPDNLSFSRPRKSERSMVEKLCTLSIEKGGRLYMVHTTCGSSVALAREIQGDRFNRNFFMESCPQYFFLTEEDLKSEEGFKYVLAPPLRSRRETMNLREEVDNLYSLGTDHCPFMLREKQHSLLKLIPFGIGGIEYSFPLMYGLLGEKIVDKMTKNPAKLFGLYPRKGVLEPGSEGDLFLFRKRKQQISGTGHSRCDYNVYENFPVGGSVETTVLHGRVAMNRGKLTAPKGHFIPRGV
jgi:dihydropyrimidinase